MKRPNLRVIGIHAQIPSSKEQKTSPIKFIEENVPNLKEEMAIKVKEAYRTPNILDHKRTYNSLIT